MLRKGGKVKPNRAHRTNVWHFYKTFKLSSPIVAASSGSKVSSVNLRSRLKELKTG